MDLKKVPASSLVIDSGWNCRGARELAPAKLSQANADGENLWQSIKALGVRMPVEVVEQSGKLHVVAGFRRAAISAFLSEAEKKDGKPERLVPVVVQRYATEAERRRANLVENMARSSLYPCEIARGVSELRRALGPATEAQTIATELGMAPQSVNNYLRIREKGSAEMLAHWDLYPETPLRAVLNVITLPKDEQLAALQEGLAKKEHNAPARVGIKVNSTDIRATSERFAKTAADKPPAWSDGVRWLAGAWGAAFAFKRATTPTKPAQDEEHNRAVRALMGKPSKPASKKPAKPASKKPAKKAPK